MTRVISVITLTIAAFGLGCSRNPDVDKVPMGSDVQVTRQDGGVVEGRLADRDAEHVRIDTGRSTRDVDRVAIADIRVVDADRPMPPPPALAKFREYTVPGGTVLTARLETTVASNVNREGDPVEAALIEPVVIDDRDVLPAGSIIKGVVSDAEPSGRVKGRARLSLRFTTLVAPARGDEYTVDASFARMARSTTDQDVKKVGVGTVGGAIVGGLIGGGKGAAAGAAVGAGAGTAVVLSTTGDEVRFEHGTIVSLTLQRPLLVRVPIKR